jgi:hypothetical protein
LIETIGELESRSRVAESGPPRADFWRDELYELLRRYCRDHRGGLDAFPAAKDDGGGTDCVELDSIYFATRPNVTTPLLDESGCIRDVE